MLRTRRESLMYNHAKAVRCLLGEFDWPVKVRRPFEAQLSL